MTAFWPWIIYDVVHFLAGLKCFLWSNTNNVAHLICFIPETVKWLNFPIIVINTFYICAYIGKKITIRPRKCHAYCYMKYVIQGKSMYHKSRFLTKSDKWRKAFCKTLTFFLTISWDLFCFVIMLSTKLWIVPFSFDKNK